MAYLEERALGLLETLALVPAIEGADKMLKAADVDLVALEAGGSTLCTVFVSGDVAACKTAVKAGTAAAQAAGKVTVSHVMPRPIPAIRAIVDAHILPDDDVPPPPWPALGLVETYGVVYLMEAADAMCKAADVTLVGYENIYDGYVSVLVQGETAACALAVEAGAKAVKALGADPYSAVVIPSPHPGLHRIIRRYSIEGWDAP